MAHFPQQSSTGVNTLESSWETLNNKKVEMEFEIDPLFGKTSAAFDEGGARGLLLNHLCVVDYTAIVFDSSDAVSVNAAVDTNDTLCDITDLKGIT